MALIKNNLPGGVLIQVGRLFKKRSSRVGAYSRGALILKKLFQGALIQGGGGA